MKNQQGVAQDKEVLEFSWWDLVRAFYFLLDDKRAKYLGYTLILVLALFYDLVPTFLIGKIIDFFTDFHIGDSFSYLYPLLELVLHIYYPSHIHDNQRQI